MLYNLESTLDFSSYSQSCLEKNMVNCHFQSLQIWFPHRAQPAASENCRGQTPQESVFYPLLDSVEAEFLALFKKHCECLRKDSIPGNKFCWNCWKLNSFFVFSFIVHLTHITFSNVTPFISWLLLSNSAGITIGFTWGQNFAGKHKNNLVFQR